MAKITVKQLVDEYYKSSDYSMLAYKTKVDYSNCLDRMLNTKINKNFINLLNNLFFITCPNCKYVNLNQF